MGLILASGVVVGHAADHGVVTHTISVGTAIFIVLSPVLHWRQHGLRISAWASKRVRRISRSSRSDICASCERSRALCRHSPSLRSHRVTGRNREALTRLYFSPSLSRPSLPAICGLTLRSLAARIPTCSDEGSNIFRPVEDLSDARIKRDLKRRHKRGSVPIRMHYRNANHKCRSTNDARLRNLPSFNARHRRRASWTR